MTIKLAIDPGLITGVGGKGYPGGWDASVGVAVQFHETLRCGAFLDTYGNWWDQSVPIDETNPLGPRKSPSFDFWGGAKYIVNLFDGICAFDSQESLPGKVNIKIRVGNYRNRLALRSFWGFAPLAKDIALEQTPTFSGPDPVTSLHPSNLAADILITKKWGRLTLGAVLLFGDGGTPSPWIGYRQPFQVEGKSEIPSTLTTIGDAEPGNLKTLVGLLFGWQSDTFNLGLQLNHIYHDERLPAKKDKEGKVTTPARDGVKQHQIHAGLAATVQGPKLAASLYGDFTYIIPPSLKNQVTTDFRAGFRLEGTLKETKAQVPDIETDAVTRPIIDPSTGEPKIKLERDPKTNEPVIDPQTGKPKPKMKVLVKDILRLAGTVTYSFRRTPQNASIDDRDGTFTLNGIALPSDPRLNNAMPSQGGQGKPGDIPCNPALCGDPPAPTTTNDADKTDDPSVDVTTIKQVDRQRVSASLSLTQTWNTSYAPFILRVYGAVIYVNDEFGGHVEGGAGVAFKF